MAAKKKKRPTQPSLDQKIRTLIEALPEESRDLAEKLVAIAERSHDEREQARKSFRVTKKPSFAGTLALGGNAHLVISGSHAGEVWIHRKGKLAREATLAEWLVRHQLEHDPTAAWATARVDPDLLVAARQMLDTQKKKSTPDPASCETAGRIYEGMGDLIHAALAFALGGLWNEMERASSSGMTDEAHRATHLTHLALALAVKETNIILPAAFPREARYVAADAKLLPAIVARMPMHVQRAFFAAIDPAIALDVFARSDERTWPTRMEVLLPAFDVLVGLLIAERVDTISTSAACRAIARFAVTSSVGSLLESLACCAALMNDTSLMTECIVRGKQIGHPCRSIANVMRPVHDGMRKLGVAAALVHLERHEEAIDLCTQAIVGGIDQWGWLAYYNRGTARASLGQWDRAAQDFDRVVELRPDHAYAFNNRASAYYQLGNLARAKESATRSIALDPKNAPAHWVMANIAAAEGDREGFYRSLERAMKLGARVWEHPWRVHERYRQEPELAALFRKYDRAS